MIERGRLLVGGGWRGWLKEVEEGGVGLKWGLAGGEGLIRTNRRRRRASRPQAELGRCPRNGWKRGLVGGGG